MSNTPKSLVKVELNIFSNILEVQVLIKLANVKYLKTIKEIDGIKRGFLYEEKIQLWLTGYRLNHEMWREKNEVSRVCIKGFNRE